MDDEIEPRWYTYGIAEHKRHPWRHYRWFAKRRADERSQEIECRVEWALFRKPGHGWGFQFGRNGAESNIGLDLHAGRIGSAFMRLRSPWTHWANIERQGDDDRGWYKARHYGISLFPHEGCYFRAEWDARENEWSRDEPWWREVKLTKWQVWGRVHSGKVVDDAGECVIPMPEGVYPATWELTRYERRHDRWPGTWRDRVKSMDSPARFVIEDIPGGIPHWGKGESSYDCGMDGSFGISGPFRTLEAAIGAAVESSLRDRNRYGGPHDLPHPMSVKEAEAWALEQRSAS